ncbi:unnamed protein product [Urochloa humidicola]
MAAKSKGRLAKLALLLLALLLLVAAILLCVFLIPHHHRKPPLPPGSPPGNASNPDDSIVAFDFSPYLIMYKSGRVYRMDGLARCSPGVDEATGVKSKDVVIDRGTGLAARMYLPPAAKGNNKEKDRLPVLVFYHGGAFVIESAFTPLYHAYLNAVISKARAVAVSVEYRLAPEHRLPAAYDDSWRALNWVARNAASGPEPWLRDRGNLSRLFVAGDSAGGNIAHDMAMRAGRTADGLDGGAAITGLLLLDPYFWGKEPVAGETTDAATRREYEATWSFICGGRYGIDDPLVNPLSLPAAELRRLASARVAVTSSGLDDFRPRALAYAAALNGSGWEGELEQYETPGERHVYFLDRPKDPNSVKELAFVTGFLSRE